MANLTFLASTAPTYEELLGQYEQAALQNSASMNFSESATRIILIALAVFFIMGFFVMIASAILRLLAFKEEVKVQKAKIEAAKVSANAELLEAHVKASEQQNSLLVRRQLEKLSDEEVLQLMKDIRKDTRKKVANSDYSHIIMDDAELDKEIDSLMKDYFDDDKDDDK